MNSEHTYYLISDVNTIYEVDYQTDVIHRSYNGHHGVVLCLVLHCILHEKAAIRLFSSYPTRIKSQMEKKR